MKALLARKSPSAAGSSAASIGSAASPPASPAASTARHRHGAPKSPTGQSKIENILSQWQELDQKLSPFERLAQMRNIVVKGDLGTQSYDLLQKLAVSRARGTMVSLGPKGVSAFEAPIMAGYLNFRPGAHNWAKKYILLFSERIEVHASKTDAEALQTKRNRRDVVQLALSEKFFVSSSITRRLKNEKEFGFMVSDFKTSLYFAADSKVSMEYWMHAISRQIRKIQSAKSFFDETKKGARNVRTVEQIESDYQKRLEAYIKSQQNTPPGTPKIGGTDTKTASSPSPTDSPQLHRSMARKLMGNSFPDSSGNGPGPGDGGASERKMRESMRLSVKATETEMMRMEHVAMQLELQSRANALEQRVEKLKEDNARPSEVETFEVQLRALEERALLEAEVSNELALAAQALEEQAAAALAQEEVQDEFYRRSVRFPAKAGVMEASDKVDHSDEDESTSTIAAVQEHEQAELLLQSAQYIAERTDETLAVVTEEAAAAEAASNRLQEQLARVTESEATGGGGGGGGGHDGDELRREAAVATIKAEEARSAAEAVAIKKRALQRTLEEQTAIVEASRQRALARMGRFKAEGGGSKRATSFVALPPDPPPRPKPAPSVIDEEEDPKLQSDVDFLVDTLKSRGGNVSMFALRAAFDEGEHLPIEGVVLACRRRRMVLVDEGEDDVTCIISLA